jgi:hypothetical protein
MEFFKNSRLQNFIESKEQSERHALAVACADISDTIFKMDHVTVRLANIQDPRHERSQQEEIIFLPDRHFDLPIFERLKAKFGESDYPRFIAYHEFGHAAQVACLDPKNGDHVQIKGSPNLNYLFNGSSVPDRINNFLKELFKEGFADCYAGLCLYKETGDIDVFRQISDVRVKRCHEIKEEKGLHFIHPNFNVFAVRNFGRTVEAFVAQGKDIFAVPFAEGPAPLEHYIERAVIGGCLAAITSELRTNDALLNQFRRFARGFGVDAHQVGKFLGHPSNLDQVVAYEHFQGIGSFFLELHKRLATSYAGVLPSSEICKLLVNVEFKRSVDSSLELMHVVDVPYSAGIEAVMKKRVVLRTALVSPEGGSSLPTYMIKLK